ncbi:hypothetical protein G3T36_00550 [Diaminobutyricibacter tongyongensis]|uniref:Uncharacterized protein n=1 Tax=Leifsonia tongyongensis TaxID=1268043 RepID=A0A6L9XSG6_9MICO|nr:hypothetical protein [Diaminobutyricibacter tongyongensis]NEN04350.1 hypothetical protein [Diaminobutyricibacter tongyongensis]
MGGTTAEVLARQQVTQRPIAGLMALILAGLAALCAPGILGLASVLYAPIAKATTISACEGPSLTPTQEHVSLLVVNLKDWAILCAVVFAASALVVGILAVGLRQGRTLGLVAIAVVLLAAVCSNVLWAFGFPMDPTLWHLPCGGG